MNTRVQNYSSLGYGLFIHYGLYSRFGEGEWYWNMNKLTKEEYYQKIGPLNQVELKPDFDGIAKWAKASGLNYIVLTTRHHDGFSLYDTKGLSSLDITHTKTQKDLIKNFVQACDKHKIKPVFYHTTLDWAHPDFENNFDNYLDYLYKSVEILTKNYGEVGGFWFDGNWSKPENDWKENELYSMIRKNQPNAIIANNTGLNDKGNLKNEFLEIITFEQGALTEQLSQASGQVVKEVCETVNDHWGFAKNDFNFKSVSQIIKSLVNIRLNKANYLINVGLTSKDKVGGLEQETLTKVGEWIKQNGFCLFEDFSVVYQKEMVSVIETKNDYFILVDNLKSGGHVDEIAYGAQALPTLELKNISNKIKTIIGLDDNEELEFSQNKDVLKIKPKSFKYGFNSIIKVYQASKEDQHA
ncbi:alpha-L-fucosidase [Spiroplasma alleghenense]|uniref:alpha-L-fucosidase n=1 Tax=Spiroplasma alleghenense TaxID=216931 RepID=A0A345Z4X6_9MOLU|nr:alpha-L-fucosidase [Spiroplasma alleghenense]AXK51655.1 alpha-L-fucosidase [Spiroplasma alleghenense]